MCVTWNMCCHYWNPFLGLLLLFSLDLQMNIDWLSLTNVIFIQTSQWYGSACQSVEQLVEIVFSFLPFKMSICLMLHIFRCHFTIYIFWLHFHFHIWYVLYFLWRLHQLRTILANSTFNINEIVGKSLNDEDFTDDELFAFNENTKTIDGNG